jgi:prevent-host-death family protein
MKSMGLFEVKNRISEICETVARTSEPVLITRRGQPLVQIQPLPRQSKSESVWNTVAEGRRKYGPLHDFELPTRAVARNRPDPLDG